MNLLAKRHCFHIKIPEAPPIAGAAGKVMPQSRIKVYKVRITAFLAMQCEHNMIYQAVHNAKDASIDCMEHVH